MIKERGFRQLLQEPVVQVYLIGCLVSLGLVALTEMARGVPVLVLATPILLVLGVIGIFAHSAVGPLLTVLLVGLGELFLQHSPDRRMATQGPLLFGIARPVELLLIAAVVAYVICQFRLHALTANLFPRDSRQRRQPPPGQHVPFHRRRRLVGRRDPRTFSYREFVATLALPIASLVPALLLWSYLAAPPRILDLPLWACRVLLALWIVFALVALAGAVLTYWRWQAWSSDEGQLVLQDAYWRQTRREQARQYRWLAWARRRGKYRKDRNPSS